MAIQIRLREVFVTNIACKLDLECVVSRCKDSRYSSSRSRYRIKNKSTHQRSAVGRQHHTRKRQC